MNQENLDKKFFTVFGYLVKYQKLNKINLFILKSYLKNKTRISSFYSFMHRSNKMKLLIIIRNIFIQFGKFNDDYDCDGYCESGFLWYSFYYRYENFRGLNPKITICFMPEWIKTYKKLYSSSL